MTKEKNLPTKPVQFALRRFEAAALLISIFMISFSVLTFEISLTRMFSVMFAYHYVFIAVAIAFAGLALGGILGKWLLPESPKKQLLATLTIIYAFFALMFSLITILTISATAPNFAATAFLFFLSFLPAGLFLSTAYKFFIGYSSTIYAADIIGAAIGSIATVTFLNGLSPVTTILLMSTILTITSLLLAFMSTKKIIGITAVLILLTLSSLFLSVRAGKDVPIGSDQGKELYAFLTDPKYGAKIVESRWSAFGRTDLVEFQNDPHHKVIFIDGGAGTQLYHFNGDFNDTSNSVNTLWNSTAAYPFYFTDNENILVIGPGGGVDVLISLMFNFSHVHAVEINQATVDIVNDYASFDGGIYSDYDNVHVHVDEGRSFLKRTGMKYDAIMLDIPITKTVQGSSGYSMAENYLFTTDSIKDYLENLNDNGYLVIVAHEQVEIYRLVMTALETLQSQGKSIAEGMKQIVVTQKGGHMSFPVFILKKTTFGAIEVGDMIQKTGEVNLMPVYFPLYHKEMNSMYDPTLVALAEGKADMRTLIEAAGLDGADISPPTDDKPFFYKFEKGLPVALPQVLIGFIVLTAIATFVYFFDWGRRLYVAPKKMKQALTEKFSVFTPYYFASLGLGFMLIEVSFAQKFILFLGSPTLAISTALFSLLLSMGIGGILSKKLKQPARLVPKISLIGGIIMLSYIFVLPFIFDFMLGLDLNIRVLVTLAVTFPGGFALGTLYPLGIRIVDRYFDSNDISWMWGINGLFSLLGSTLAVVIAISFGFSAALLLGGILYVMIFPLSRLFLKEEIEPT